MGVTSSSAARSRWTFSSPLPFVGTKTTDLPVGLPHDEARGSNDSAGRLGALPRPRTSRFASSARSPWGPQAKGPGSGASKRQARRAPSGERAQARPFATNDTVSPGAAAGVGHVVGSGSPLARRGPDTGGGGSGGG